VDITFARVGKLVLTTSRFLQAHNPTSKAGRLQLKHTILRSGPAYQNPSPDDDDSSQSQQFSGWRMGALLSCALLVSCLLTELILLIAALGLRKATVEGGYNNVLYEGSCTITKRWTTLTALLLNFIATLTISTSNYVMQCLSSPSENEVRFAHKNGRSLQIGVSSPSNVKWVSELKTLLWWLMGASSIPVHLLLNSAFFSSLQTNNYGIAVVTGDFETKSLWPHCTSSNTYYNVTPGDNQPWLPLACSIMTEANKYEKLDNAKCIDQYSNQLLSQYSNVILVSNLNSSNTNVTAEHR
jgi:hypothetical protein